MGKTNKGLMGVIIVFICLFGVNVQLSAEETTGQQAALNVASLSLQEFSNLVLDNNLDIQIARYNAYIERTRGKDTESVFDTMLKAQAVYLNDQSKTGSTFAGTKTMLNEYTLGLSKRLPTGTTLSVDIGDMRTSNNSAFTTLNPTHEASVKLSLHQPIGNNFFGLLDRGRIKITKLDIASSDYSALDRIEGSLAQAQINYWTLVLAYRQLKIGRQMLIMAENFYEQSIKQADLGMIEKAELFAAQANVLNRKNNVATFMHRLRIANNILLLDLHEEDLNMQIIPRDIFVIKDMKITAQERMKQVAENNRDYLQAKNSLQAKGINLSMKNNSIWPKIALEVSLADNGLELKQTRAWNNVTDENNPELFLGLSVSMSLENRAAKSQREKARLEKTKALVDFKKIEHKILVEIINAVDVLNNRTESIKFNQQIAKLQEHKLDFEEKRFASGRSNSDTLIRYQEDMLNAQLTLAKSLFEYEQASVALKQVENSLLEDHFKGEL